MNIAAIRKVNGGYVDSIDAFSPAEGYPEYSGTISLRPNPIYAAVRKLFCDVRLDPSHFGTADWNPLGGLIPLGSTVFVLCNFVYHKRKQETREQFYSKCTHASVLRPTIDYILKAVGTRGKVLVGNAPLQSCDWDAVLCDTGTSELIRYYQMLGLPVYPKDLRLVVRRRSIAGNVLAELVGNNEDAVLVNLDQTSCLTDIDTADVRYRVSDYDPARTELFHGYHRHRYLINRNVLDADVIFSVPKLKTHEKVGMTCTIKGFVGAVAHKDSLAHHRSGSSKRAGDEYARESRLQRWVSLFHENIYRDGGRSAAWMQQIIDVNFRRLLRRLGYQFFGAWHGNDTTWRMAVDLARILYFYDQTNHGMGQHQRRHLSLIDGIIGGEGNGPLSPTPVNSGMLIFSDNAAIADYLAAKLMGFDPEKLPIVKNCFGNDAYALAPDFPLAVFFDGVLTPIDKAIDGTKIKKFHPPDGWQGVL